MIFLERAEEFLETAKTALAKEMYNVAAFNAGQAAISANDAVTMKFINRRASRDHNEALQLHREVVVILGDDEGRKYLSELLEARRIYGYTAKDCSKAESERLVRNAERFVAWTRKVLK